MRHTDCWQSPPISLRLATNDPLLEEFYPVHMVSANVGSWDPPWQLTNQALTDDVYLDITWARVMVGNAPAYGHCTHLVPQIPTAWSEHSITVSSHLGALPRVVTPYLYVIDADGRVNQNGYPMVVAP